MSAAGTNAPSGGDDTPRLLIGLGNPGRDYAQTRHNVGFMILDRLAARWGVTFNPEKKWRGELARAGDIRLLKPMTYMNLSGESAAAVAAFYRIPPARCLIVYDDKDLPFGHLRLREKGSAGGHNGMKSLIACLGTDAFPRLRFGIAALRPEASAAAKGEGLVGHVLGGFAPEEKEALEKRLDRAVESLHYAARHGVLRAMNHFNRPEAAPAPRASAPRPLPKADPPTTA